MSTPNSFAARLAETRASVSRDLLAFIDAEALEKAEKALSAARTEANNGEPTTETILKVAEAAAYAQRVLDDAAKFAAAQATLLDHPVTDAAKRIRAGKALVNRWREQPEVDFEDAHDAWWAAEPLGVDDVFHEVEDMPMGEGSVVDDGVAAGHHMSTPPVPPHPSSSAF